MDVKIQQTRETAFDLSVSEEYVEDAKEKNRTFIHQTEILLDPGVQNPVKKTGSPADRIYPVISVVGFKDFLWVSDNQHR